MVRRYTVLSMIGSLYRILAFLCFLTTSGGVVFAASNALKGAPVNADTMQKLSTVLADSLPIAVVGFILMITFWAFSEIIDLLVSVAGNMRSMARVMQEEAKEEREQTNPIVRARGTLEESRKAAKLGVE